MAFSCLHPDFPSNTVLLCSGPGLHRAHVQTGSHFASRKRRKQTYLMVSVSTKFWLFPWEPSWYIGHVVRYLATPYLKGNNHLAKGDLIIQA